AVLHLRSIGHAVDGIAHGCSRPPRSDTVRSMQEQKRARRIAMTKDELDAFLGEQRTCRLGSVDGDGAPLVSPLWFVWDGSALWLWSLVKSQRWVNLMRDTRVGVAVDSGRDYGELRGVELLGRVTPVGHVPRVDDAHRATAGAE